MTDKSETPEEEPLPKLPRAPLFGKPSGAALGRIGMFGVMLYALVMMRKPCSEGVGRFVGQFGDAPDAAPPSLSEQYPGYQLVTAEEALELLRKSAPFDAGALMDAGADAALLDAAQSN